MDSGGHVKSGHRVSATALDAAELAQCEREVMFGRPAHLDYQLEDGRCAPDCPDCALRDLRRRYRCAARDRVRRQGIPRLPKGTGDNARAILRDSRHALATARAMYCAAQTFGTPRRMIDAACEYELCERIFNSHVLTFRSRCFAEVKAEAAQKASAQMRVFLRDTLTIPKSATTLPPRFAPEKVGPNE
jgi:hypothetical protein